MKGYNIKNVHYLSLLGVILLGILLYGCKFNNEEDKSLESNNNVSDIILEIDTKEDNSESNKEANIVKKLPQGYIIGMDMSMTIAQENSGVKYKNNNGEEEDVFKIIHDAGINYVRVRVWNNPYDAEGNGYGGGNTDINNAIEISKRASKYDLKMLIDFHYSDFWADVKKQQCPKQWQQMNIDEKVSAIYEYTFNSIEMLLDEGADIGMVQIGNEIDIGIAGEYSEESAMKLLASASKAVRDVSAQNNKDIKIVVHFGSSDDSVIKYKADMLALYNIDYDVFGISFYTFWGNTVDRAKECLLYVKEKYNKETCILETSWSYTEEDGDGFANSFSESAVSDYEVSVEGQKKYILDIVKAAYDADAIGVFYWGGEWIPVGRNKEENTVLWEQYGSGWASSFAGEYDSEDAGRYYGGSGWDNQALFDFEGKALDSLYFMQDK